MELPTGKARGSIRQVVNKVPSRRNPFEPSPTGKTRDTRRRRMDEKKSRYEIKRLQG